jgi:hypothetical protein
MFSRLRMKAGLSRLRARSKPRWSAELLAAPRLGSRSSPSLNILFPLLPTSSGKELTLTNFSRTAVRSFFIALYVVT